MIDSKHAVGYCMTDQEFSQTDGKAGRYIYFNEVTPGDFLYSGNFLKKVLDRNGIKKCIWKLVDEEWFKSECGSYFTGDEKLNYCQCCGGFIEVYE